MHRGFWDINGHTHVYLGEGPEAARVWAAAIDDEERKVVASEEVEHVFVSTVFIGIDQGYGKGPPLLFETMAFVHDGGDPKYDHVCWWYATWDKAAQGHKSLVRQIRAGVDPKR
jgi:hypothetical protein